jgi:hypothetical protein
LVATQVPASGSAQANPDDAMSDDILMDANVMSLSGNVSGESDFGSWSSEGGKLGSPFSWMDDESLEDDLDYFVALDLAAAESPLRTPPPPRSTGDFNRCIPSRSRLRIGPRLDQGARRELMASTSCVICIPSGFLTAGVPTM